MQSQNKQWSPLHHHHPNPHKATPPPMPESTIPPSPPQTLLPLLQLLPLVHLSVWGYKGCGRTGVGRAPKSWGGGGGGGCRSGEVPLWRTCTIIKDSTAASGWFACLVIYHMLHSATISHIRAFAPQQTSLKAGTDCGGAGTMEETTTLHEDVLMPQIPQECICFHCTYSWNYTHAVKNSSRHRYLNKEQFHKMPFQYITNVN